MRLMRYFLPLLFIFAAPASGLQQYSEGACILLDQQVQRFSHIPQSSSYRNAKSEYDKNCRKPNKPATRPTQPEVAKPAEPQPQTTPVEITQPEPIQAADTAVDTAPPEVSVSPPAEIIATPVAVAEQLLQAEPAKDKPAETETPQAVGNDLPVPVVVPSTNETIISGNWWQFDNLLTQLVNNLPLIIANIFAFLLAVFLLTNWLGLNLPGFKGIFAEYKLNRLLRWRLARGYRHFRKLKLLTAKEELVVVDHLVLSPFGIFVIMVKGYRGSIYGNVAEANWMRQYFGSKKQFMNPLHQNFKHVEAIKHHLQLQNTELAQHVHSVVAFSRVAQFKTEMPANVTYVDTAPAYLKKFEEPCFDDDQLNRFAALLRQASTAN